MNRITGFIAGFSVLTQYHDVNGDTIYLWEGYHWFLMDDYGNLVKITRD